MDCGVSVHPARTWTSGCGEVPVTLAAKTISGIGWVCGGKMNGVVIYQIR